MRRASLCLWLGLLVPLCAHAQVEQKAPTQPQEVNADPWIWWKWANFLILAGVLGYLINKSAGTYYRNQKEEIKRGIAEASKIKLDAETRSAQIERRLAGLQSEIETLRTSAREEMKAETERINRETMRHIERMQQQAEQEIELMTRAARHEIKTYSADLALQLAETRIRSGLNSQTQEALANAFLRDLRDGAHKTAGAR